MMLRMRYGSNPPLATVAIELLRDYVEFPRGERVWVYVVRGEDGAPSSWPNMHQVLAHDQAIKDLRARLTKAGHNFKKALF